ncbi:MAG: HNH endonuclease [Magnetococcus sp. WYHC-3]
MERGENGQFILTTGSTIYKKQQLDGKTMGAYKKKLCLALGIVRLPREFIIHHLDGNKRNDHIDNLAIMTITAHNRIHAHEPWNKGIKAVLSKKWANANKKAQLSRFKTFLPKFKRTFELQVKGKKLKEIALMEGISRRQVSERIMRYKNITKVK